MRRIFPDHTYQDARIADCFWAETVPDAALERPALDAATKVDVAVIGAGFTGLSAAHALSKAGASVAVLDARFPGWGASGRNGGFCCLGGAKAEDDKIDKAHSKSARLEYRLAEKAAVDHVADFLTEHSVDAQRHSNGETCLAHNARVRFDDAAAHYEENYGITPDFHSKSALEGLGMRGDFHGAMTVRHGFGLNPRAYMKGLLETAEANGAQVYGNTPVTAICRGARYKLQTPRGTVEADKLIFATNGYSSEDVPEWMAARYLPSQSSIIVTRELTDAELENGWNSDQMSYDSRHLLHYFRLMPNRRFLFGVRGGILSSPAAEARVQRRIRSDFERMFPAWRHVETPHYWSGMVCLSWGFTPFAGAIPDMPGAYAGFAYHGNGVALGSYTGALLADQVLGADRLETPRLMQAEPPRFPLGSARRALMIGIYGVAGLQDL